MAVAVGLDVHVDVNGGKGFGRIDFMACVHVEQRGECRAYV